MNEREMMHRVVEMINYAGKVNTCYRYTAALRGLCGGSIKRHIPATIP